MEIDINFISDNILDLLHYKKVEDIRNIIKNKNHPNLIIYGPSRCGKSSISK